MNQVRKSGVCYKCNEPFVYHQSRGSYRVRTYCDICKKTAFKSANDWYYANERG